jgi:ribosomal protein L12E/L44/L45/RPP1/RPP2
MEKLSISDVLLTYKNDSDKIAILGKALEMMLDYTDKIEQSFSNINENIRMIAEAITTLGTEVKRIDTELLTLKGTVSSDISKLVDEVKETAAVVASASAAAPVAAPARSSAHKTAIVEENLMKPSSLGRSLGGAPDGALGGGMSIRSAMMAEIKQKIHGPSAPPPGASPSSMGASSEVSSGPEKAGEIGGGYIPSIQKPREAKTIEGGVVSKMNKLLEAKFKSGSSAAEPPSAGPPSAVPKKGTKTAGPPSAVPKKDIKVAIPPPIAMPPKGSEAVRQTRGSRKSFLPTDPPPEAEDKKEEKKKEKKEKKKDPQLNGIERKIREKLG